MNIACIPETNFLVVLYSRPRVDGMFSAWFKYRYLFLSDDLCFVKESHLRPRRLSPTPPKISRSTRAQSVATRAPVVPPGGRRSGSVSTKSTAVGLGCWLLVFAHPEVVDQKGRRVQKVLSIHRRYNVHRKVKEMAYDQPVEHVKIGISHKDRERQIGKGEVDGLDREAPDVRLVGWVALGPDVEDVIDQVLRKNRGNGKAEAHQKGVRSKQSERAQQDAKCVVGGSTSGPRVEGTTRFVLFAELHQHVHRNEGIETKISGVTKGRQKPPDLHARRYIFPGPNYLVRANNSKIRGKGYHDGSTKPVAGDDW
ncbi:unnamed protein product [Pseudo-nitzschia multistriata]|uniref:Uncharacterized protein n=1 Tax=Pseudo-nitzschia multistriata TaxID=183589 RepID=A0A448YUB3_9STRA|nr:unnamed protein product [Pseudo-nitzschia multistriata]